MNESRRIAEQLEKALKGPAWHGPSWREVLEGVTLGGAVQHPVSGGHSIAEIVLHVTTWHDVARRRFGGETPQVTDEQDWPHPAFASEAEWQAGVQRLFDTGQALVETIAGFPAERLEDERGGNAGTWYGLAIGMLQHDLYHAGQVGLLRKAAVAVPA